MYLSNFNKFLLSSFLFSSSLIFAIPQNPTIVSGSASISSDNNHMQIVTSDRSIINWDSFSIGFLV